MRVIPEPPLTTTPVTAPGQDPVQRRSAGDVLRAGLRGLDFDAQEARLAPAPGEARDSTPKGAPVQLKKEKKEEATPAPSAGDGVVIEVAEATKDDAAPAHTPATAGTAGPTLGFAGFAGATGQGSGFELSALGADPTRAPAPDSGSVDPHSDLKSPIPAHLTEADTKVDGAASEQLAAQTRLQNPMSNSNLDKLPPREPSTLPSDEHVKVRPPLPFELDHEGLPDLRRPIPERPKNTPASVGSGARHESETSKTSKAPIVRQPLPFELDHEGLPDLRRPIAEQRSIVPMPKIDSDKLPPKKTTASTANDDVDYIGRLEAPPLKAKDDGDSIGRLETPPLKAENDGDSIGRLEKAKSTVSIDGAANAGGVTGSLNLANASGGSKGVNLGRTNDYNGNSSVGFGVNQSMTTSPGKTAGIGMNAAFIKQGDLSGASANASLTNGKVTGGVSQTRLDGGKVTQDPATGRWIGEYTTLRSAGGIAGGQGGNGMKGGASGGYDKTSKLRIRRSFASEAAALAFMDEEEKKEKAAAERGEIDHRHDEGKDVTLLGKLEEGDEISKDDIDKTSATGGLNTVAGSISVAGAMEWSDTVSVVRKGDGFEVTVKEMRTDSGSVGAGAVVVGGNIGGSQASGKQKKVKVPATEAGKKTIARILAQESFDGIGKGEFETISTTDIDSKGDSIGVDFMGLSLADRSDVTTETERDGQGKDVKTTTTGLHQDSLASVFSPWHSKESQTLKVVNPSGDDALAQYYFSATLDMSTEGQAAEAFTELSGSKSQAYGSDERLKRDYTVTGEFTDAQIKTLIAHMMSSKYSAAIESGRFLKMYGGQRIGSDIEALHAALKGAGGDRVGQAHALADFVSEAGTGGLRFLMETTAEVGQGAGKDVPLSVSVENDWVFSGPLRQHEIKQTLQQARASLAASPVDRAIMPELYRLADDEHEAYLALVDRTAYPEVSTRLRDERRAEAIANYKELMAVADQFRTAPTPTGADPELDFKELPAGDKAAWVELGMDPERWSGEKDADPGASLGGDEFEFNGQVVEAAPLTAPIDREWASLSLQQQEAATSLGFDEDTWDSFDELATAEARKNLVAELQGARTARTEVESLLTSLRNDHWGTRAVAIMRDTKFERGFLPRLRAAGDELGQAEDLNFGLRDECVRAAGMAAKARQNFISLRAELRVEQEYHFGLERIEHKEQQAKEQATYEAFLRRRGRK